MRATLIHLALELQAVRGAAPTLPPTSPQGASEASLAQQIEGCVLYLL